MSNYEVVAVYRGKTIETIGANKPKTAKKAAKRLIRMMKKKEPESDAFVEIREMGDDDDFESIANWWPADIWEEWDEEEDEEEEEDDEEEDEDEEEVKPIKMMTGRELLTRIGEVAQNLKDNLVVAKEGDDPGFFQREADDAWDEVEAILKRLQKLVREPREPKKNPSIPKKIELKTEDVVAAWNEAYELNSDYHDLSDEDLTDLRDELEERTTTIMETLGDYLEDEWLNLDEDDEEDDEEEEE